MDNQTAAPLAPQQPTGDEKMLALFSHLSLFFGGIILPIIFWAINKDKSKFVTFHSLQAVWFHVAYLFVFVFIIFFALVGGFGMAALGGISSTHMKGSSMPPIVIILIIAFYGLIFLVACAGIAYAIYMGVKAYHGELKKYPVIGNIIYKKVYGSN